MSNVFKIAFEEAQEPIDTRTIEEIDEEHQRLALEIDEDSRELEYQNNLVEGLESLRMIATQLDKPTSNQVALFKVAANMAVAGTKQSAQDFLPAMESNQQIAIEGFGTKIKELVTAIIAKLMEFWKRIKDFFKNIFNRNKIIDKKVKEAGETLEKKKSKFKEVTLRIPRSMITTKQYDGNKLTVDDFSTNVVTIYKTNETLGEALKYLSRQVGDSLKLLTKANDEEVMKNIIDKFLDNIDKLTKEFVHTKLDIVGCKSIFIDTATNRIVIKKDDEKEWDTSTNFTLNSSNVDSFNTAKEVLRMTYSGYESYLNFEYESKEFFKTIDRNYDNSGQEFLELELADTKIKYFNMLMSAFNNSGYIKFTTDFIETMNRFKKGFVETVNEAFPDTNNN